MIPKSSKDLGGALAEWSKALLVRENHGDLYGENKESPKSSSVYPGLDNLLKVGRTLKELKIVFGTFRF